MEVLIHDATCAICLDFFKDPLTVNCGHNFCKNCITDLWEKTETVASCPKCRTELTCSFFRPNRELACIVEGIKKLNEPSLKAIENICEEHEEKLKLFCEDEQRPICLVCEKSYNHKNHTIVPVEEAIKEYKANVSSERERIIAEFDQLYTFLNYEKRALLMKLEEEEKQLLETVEKNIQMLSEQISSLHNFTDDIEKQLNLPNTAFLKTVRKSFKRYENTTQKVPLPTKPFNAQKFRFPLQYFTWKKMSKVLIPAPAPLTLDPVTADSEVGLYKSYTAAMCVNTSGTMSMSPKKGPFLCATGFQGFTTGIHYWEVNIDSDICLVGVICDCTGTSENKYWFEPAKQNTKLGVYLDYEGGQLSFYNGDMSHIRTQKCCFVGKVFPVFWLQSSTAIEICHLNF
ncbi:E3 ubiquitin-protein ligase TRIM39-like isoform X2 [Protopterus annectens]|uniref:E3 ubiquitin-protein ligase TRIM39-like isoform X2 n=1 Tax=Protopterus annectens TaxID=7888 RepID=UPI001CFC22B5|nr:E3 ubiquitin-protein ligase TRIM39-like isoform X2 [Protopterus annectens]